MTALASVRDLDSSMAFFKCSVTLHDSVVFRFPSCSGFMLDAENLGGELIAFHADVLVLLFVEVEVSHGLFASVGSLLHSVDLFDSLVVLVFQVVVLVLEVMVSFLKFVAVMLEHFDLFVIIVIVGRKSLALLGQRVNFVFHRVAFGLELVAFSLEVAYLIFTV